MDNFKEIRATLHEKALEMEESASQSYHQDAKRVHFRFSHDFSVEGDGREVRVVDLFLEEELAQDEKLKAMNINAILKELEKLSGEHPVKDQPKRTAYVLTRLVKLFPDRIPRYFAEYQATVKYPDATLEIFKEEIEPLILFSLSESKEGRALPKTFPELKEKYEKSLQPDIIITESDISRTPEIIDESEYYLLRPDIQKLITENWPEIWKKYEEVFKNLKRPIISNNPDDLEIWEAEQRRKRMSELNSWPPLHALQAILYEELFLANSNPGAKVTFKGSFAPSPGGMLSHGYPYGSFGGATIETVVSLNFTGSTAKEAVASLTDWSHKDQLASIISHCLYPQAFGVGAGESERLRRDTVKTLMVDKFTPSEDVDTWGYRLIKLYKTEPFLSEFVGPDLLSLLSPNAKDIPFGRYWHMIWRKIGSALLTRNDQNQDVYRDPNLPEIKAVIEKMLILRLHPETQKLFKYLSSSGLLNNKE